MNILPCFKCGRELAPAFDGEEIDYPNKGTIFTSHGNYGSTVFDPVHSDAHLRINICDECLKLSKVVNHLVPKVPDITITQYDVTRWNYEDYRE